MTTLDLFRTDATGAAVVRERQSLPEARAARDAALDRVEANTDDAWRAAAWDVIVHLCRTRPELVSDDVWKLVEKPPSPKALGPLMKRAVREGMIERGGVRLTAQVSRHAAPVTVWRSLVYRRPA